MRRAAASPATATIKPQSEGFPSPDFLPALAIPHAKAHNGGIQQNPVVEDL